MKYAYFCNRYSQDLKLSHLYNWLTATPKLCNPLTEKQDELQIFLKPYFIKRLIFFFTYRGCSNTKTLALVKGIKAILKEQFLKQPYKLQQHIIPVYVNIIHSHHMLFVWAVSWSHDGTKSFNPPVVYCVPPSNTCV